jgi:hypothetical protein
MDGWCNQLVYKLVSKAPEMLSNFPKVTYYILSIIRHVIILPFTASQILQSMACHSLIGCFSFLVVPKTMVCFPANGVFRVNGRCLGLRASKGMQRGNWGMTLSYHAKPAFWEALLSRQVPGEALIPVIATRGHVRTFHLEDAGSP